MTAKVPRLIPEFDTRPFGLMKSLVSQKHGDAARSYARMASVLAQKQFSALTFVVCAHLMYAETRRNS